MFARLQNHALFYYRTQSKRNSAKTRWKGGEVDGGKEKIHDKLNDEKVELKVQFQFVVNLN